MKDYKKILEGVVNIISTTEKSDIGFANICTYIGENCPELAELEDERIRKAIINVFANHKDYEVFFGVSVKDILAWLEKQGEKKSIDDLTPQEAMDIAVGKCFEEGEQKPTDEEMKFILRTEYEKGRADAIAKMQKPWTEEDEKIFEYAIIMIEWYSIVNKSKSRQINDWLKSLKDRVQPQPKQGEQNLVLRDTFGYEDGRLFGMNEGIGLVLDNPEKYGLQKPVKWSKEDESVISLILSICNDFLESFEISPASTKVVKEDIDKIKNWLKSLRPQNRWKPSDEQMKALYDSVPKNVMEISEREMLLDKLYMDLKRL